MMSEKKGEAAKCYTIIAQKKNFVLSSHHCFSCLANLLSLGRTPYLLLSYYLRQRKHCKFSVPSKEMILILGKLSMLRHTILSSFIHADTPNCSLCAHIDKTERKNDGKRIGFSHLVTAHQNCSKNNLPHSTPLMINTFPYHPFSTDRLKLRMICTFTSNTQNNHMIMENFQLCQMSREMHLKPISLNQRIKVVRSRKDKTFLRRQGFKRWQ